MTEPHPPIPPNCNIISNVDHDDEQIVLHAQGSRYTEPESAILIRTRPIIAALAEVAWLKVADANVATTLEHPDNSIRVDIPGDEEAVHEAVTNAHAWREWGEQGETP